MEFAAYDIVFSGKKHRNQRKEFRQNEYYIASGYRLNIERRTKDIAFIHGQIDFSDTSALDFKEFVEKTDIGIEKYKYGYNYRKNTVLLFRYDNAPDPGARHLYSFPHNKHTGDGLIMNAHSVTLAEVLEEIQNIILKEWKL